MKNRQERWAPTRCVSALEHRDGLQRSLERATFVLRRARLLSILSGYFLHVVQHTFPVNSDIARPRLQLQPGGSRCPQEQRCSLTRLVRFRSWRRLLPW